MLLIPDEPNSTRVINSLGPRDITGSPENALGLACRISSTFQLACDIGPSGALTRYEKKISAGTQCTGDDDLTYRAYA
jgi:hypothetical protein